MTVLLGRPTCRRTYVLPGILSSFLSATRGAQPHPATWPEVCVV